MARVIWNPLASADLTEIAEHISGDSHEQAQSVVRQILSTVEGAGEMPELGSIVPNTTGVTFANEVRAGSESYTACSMRTPLKR